MSDGAARLLKNHLSSKALEPLTRQVFQDAYDRLTSRDRKKAWTSGQWMTERSGGSDVSGTETIATHVGSPEIEPGSDVPLGPWRIDGFKWFSSATDSSMAVLLAQTPEGLSAFFAPIYRSPARTESNGIFIQRLKNKFGTKSLPTAEIELSGSRGCLIGKEGHGIQEISAILNITRLYTAVSAVGYLGRGLAIAKSFARVREVGAGKGKRVMLKDAPLHMNTLAKVTGEYHSLMLFTFFGSWLLGISEQSSLSGFGDQSVSRKRLLPDSPSDLALLLRIIFPVLKASVSKRSIHALQECMEALGGVGYLENTENEAINIARLYRDCCVLSIWEGTTNVLASDALRVLKGWTGNDVLNALDCWVAKALDSVLIEAIQSADARKAISVKWVELKRRLLQGNQEDLLASARDILFEVADVVMAVLLIVDSENDMSPAAMEVCMRFLEGHGMACRKFSTAEGSSKDILALNQTIVYGEDLAQPARGQSRL